MKGIYKIENNINHKKYIGQSINLEERRKRHLSNINNPRLQNQLYQAIRKYGIQNFSYEVLVEDDNLTQEELNNLEKYYINYYNSYREGYNMTTGGSVIPEERGEKKLNQEEIDQIIELLVNSTTPLQDIGTQFQVSSGTISLINNGKTNWDYRGRSIPLRAIKSSYQGENNGNAKFSNKEVIEIRKLYVNKSLEEIYKLYKDRCSYSEMKKICYGVQFKNLPVYKKRQKVWLLNGTCTDYPE